MQPHPLFTFGPVAFVALSFALSVPLAGRVMRRAERWQARRGPFGFRSPWMVRAACLVATTGCLWAAATLVGGLLLVAPSCGAPAGLPGARVDATMIAHAVPPLSRLAAERMVEQLVQPDRVGRWDPPGELERRLVLAGRVDPRPGRAVARLAAAGLRSRAGGLARGRPSPETCDEGLRALAEALRGGALQELMVACRNAPGDGVGHAAFVVGDFMRAVGAEAESIVSRQPQAPAAEPRCFAGGGETPGADMPLCRLVHAELVRSARAEVLADAPRVAPWADRWASAMRSESGAPLAPGSRGGVDPALLVVRPGEAVIDQPVAVYEDQLERGAGPTAVEDRAWMRLAIAAARSAAGRHAIARDLVDEAIAELDASAGDAAAPSDAAAGGDVESDAAAAGDVDPAAHEARGAALRLAVAIAVRGGDTATAEALGTSLDDADPLRADVAWLLGEREAAPSDWPAWTRAVVARAGGATIAEALQRDARGATVGLVRLAAVPEADRGPLREWLREAFPACDGCGFFDRLAHHEARLDAARALGDDALVEALEPIVARFEAVVMTRGLALSLRAAHVPRGAP